MEKIENVLNFIMEIEKLKNVYRKSRPIGIERYENSAEHSWHVCISALMLKDFTDEDINIERVIKMLLIHDLGEIDIGDTIIYESETKELKEREARAVERILGFLSRDKREEYMALWHEFESGKTSDSKFAKAVDRVPPLLQNLNGGGYTWKKHNITREMVISVNERINEASRELWKVLKDKIDSSSFFDQ